MAEEDKKKKNKNLKMDWTIELARIPATLTIIFGHMFLYSQWLPSGHWLGFPIPIAIGIFMYCSGYVNGLKNKFSAPGTLTLSKYGNYVKNRFIRLYIGYYLALTSVFIARLVSGSLVNPDILVNITPWTLFMDLTSTWSVFDPGAVIASSMGAGSIWSEGWFIGANFLVSLLYPILNRLMSKNRIYIYLIFISFASLRVSIILYAILSGNLMFTIYAYFTWFAWIDVYTLGLILGDKYRITKGIPIVKTKFQRLIVRIGIRTWPMYLTHIIPIVFISKFAAPYEFIIIFLIILPLTELYYRILKKIYTFIKKWIK
ncbi:MAG: hypothetical protein GF329_20065 [Candidatus Lokiarchaeota archaeon]|nr:hypothetical protein [Candidatus Lokiarchaeota archaeon]